MMPKAADRLVVQVVIDNVTDSQSSRPVWAEPEWAVLQQAGMGEMRGDRLLAAHHGLSLWIRAEGAGGHGTLLLDGGPDGAGIERNVPRLGLRLGEVDDVVLSHGHFDHGQGLTAAIRMTHEESGRRVPLHLHPGMFRPRGIRQPSGAVSPMAVVPPPDAWRQLGAEPIVSRERHLAANGFLFVSGEIPRTTAYERGLPGHVVRREDGVWEDDPLVVDERCVVAHVRGRGLIVFSSCSHAGIVNVVRHVRDLFPGQAIAAVIGGLHLVRPNEAAIPDTLRDLRGLDVETLVLGHCTGWRAIAACAQVWDADHLVPMAVGSRFTFG